MREIKFRAFYKKEENAVMRFLSTLFLWPKGLHYFRSYPPNTVGEHQQYTGLNDKNNKEIYEGDIIKSIDLNTSKECVTVVGFDTFGIYYTSIEKYPSEPYENCKCVAQEYSEVIGNIFENPELIKN
jgi:uncharacterized phage protein (TIGR01671 family)